MNKPRKNPTGAMRGGMYSAVVTAVVLAILIAVNVAVSALPASATEYDISASKLYSVTSNTKSVVNALTEDVTIYWIVQADQEDAVIEKLLDRRSHRGGKAQPGRLPHFRRGVHRRGRRGLQQLPGRRVRRAQPLHTLYGHLHHGRRHVLLQLLHQLRRRGGHHLRHRLCDKPRPALGLHPHRPRGERAARHLRR